MLQDYDLHASSVQIIDIEQAPQVAKEAQVIGVPALVKEHPFPRKSVIGDLADATIVLQALGLPITKERYAASVAESPMETAVPRTAVDALLQNSGKTLAEGTIEAAHLTEREVDVLRLLGNGESNNAISETLGITLDTTKKRVRNVIDKLQARSRTHAAIIAAQAGIVATLSHLPLKPNLSRG
jgi:DNA-binding CsgD family transcriptional regulator